MVKTFVPPDKVWDFFLSGKLTDEEIVAYDPETDGEIVVANCGDCLEITGISEAVVFNDIAADRQECEEMLNEAFAYTFTVDIEADDDDWENEVYEDAEEREEELLGYTEDFLLGLLGDEWFIDHPEDRNLAEEILDTVCRTVYTKRGISVYRPMLMNNGGKAELVEYPYPVMA